MTASLLTLTAGDALVQVDPDVGGRLVSWCVGDLELLGGRSRVPEEYGCYPMAPWPGRLRGNWVDLQWPGAVTMACRSDARWMVVFDELPDLVCIEPQTAPPGLSTDAHLVRPSSPKRASVTWSWDPAPV